MNFENKIKKLSTETFIADKNDIKKFKSRIEDCKNNILFFQNRIINNNKNIEENANVNEKQFLIITGKTVKGLEDDNVLSENKILENQKIILENQKNIQEINEKYSWIPSEYKWFSREDFKNLTRKDTKITINNNELGFTFFNSELIGDEYNELINFKDKTLIESKSKKPIFDEKIKILEDKCKELVELYSQNDSLRHPYRYLQYKLQDILDQKLKIDKDILDKIENIKKEVNTKVSLYGKILEDSYQKRIDYEYEIKRIKNSKEYIQSCEESNDNSVKTLSENMKRKRYREFSSRKETMFNKLNRVACKECKGEGNIPGVDTEWENNDLRSYDVIRDCWKCKNKHSEFIFLKIQDCEKCSGKGQIEYNRTDCIICKITIGGKCAVCSNGDNPISLKMCDECLNGKILV